MQRLDHVSIRTLRLDATRAFYTEVLGLEVGPRPDFPFPGVWLYHGAVAAIHVIGIDRDDAAGLTGYLGDRGPEGQDGTGAIDHIAFLCDGIDDVRARVQAAGVAMRERQVPGMALRQIFVEDPNGVTIELNFPG